MPSHRHDTAPRPGSVHTPDSVTNMALHIVNPKTLLMSVGAVAAGSAADVLRGNLEFMPAVLCLLFAVLAQASGNAVHHYFDSTRRACPHASEGNTEGRLVISRLGQCLALGAAMVGLGLLGMTQWWGVGFAAAIIALEWLANCGDRPLMATPWAAVITFLLFGPVCVLGTAMVQSEYEATEHFTMYDLTPALFMAAVMGLQAVECHLLISYFNRSYALKRDSRTFATAFGPHATIGLMGVLAAVCVLAMAAMCVVTEGIDHHSAPVWLAFLPVPLLCLAVNLYVIIRMPKARDAAEQRRLRFILEAKMAFAGIGTFIAFWIIRQPDDSVLRYF